ncbi:MAG: phosphoribosylformylglycinamidine synthase subunit PurQ [Acidobacteria bacterium]|nr:phosphoribosylformylglycinamidine synthase subunit PurQ [Acidobacteriota bacterium]
MAEPLSRIHGSGGPRFGVVVFPGSNSDRDAFHVLKDVLSQDTVWLWHKDVDLKGCDVVVLPGGFAHGDYLRCGAIARFSPIMTEVASHAKRGGYVLGICNGFQVLVEAGLLPGALIRNTELRFISRNVHARVEREGTAFSSGLPKGAVLTMPISHGEGNYVADPGTLERLEGEGRVLFRYTSPEGRLDPAFNFNGSMNAIAGILNERGNVMGLMPHPERMAEKILGGDDGLAIFTSLVASAGLAAAPGGRR